MSSIIRRILSRQLIHIQKSQFILSNKRHFAEDSTNPNNTTSTTVIEKEKEALQTQDAIEQVEEFEMPPIRPTYQVYIVYSNILDAYLRIFDIY